MSSEQLILIYLFCAPIVTVISFGICMFLFNRDAELIIKNGFKKALKDTYQEVYREKKNE